MTTIPRMRPATCVEFFSVGNEGILFDRVGQRLFHLNPMAVHIWRRIEHDCRLGTTLNATSPSMRSRPAGVSRYVLHMLRTWRHLGLLHGAVAPQQLRRSNGSVELPHPMAAPAIITVNPLQRRYRVLDTIFSIGFPNAVLEAVVHPVIAHLEAQSVASDVCRLDLVEADGSFRVLQDGRLLACCAVRETLAPLVLGTVGLLATRRYPYLMALHAAGLAVSGGALLLAGRSRSGKTVLAAAMIAAGWSYLSDDTVLLVPHTLDAVGVPYSLGVKRGGWGLVTRHCPPLEQTAVHLRQDGKPIRYLSPPRGQSIAQPLPVRWLGFPSRAKGRGAHIRPLGQLEGLRRVLEHCCAIPRLLTSDDVQSLIRWSATIRFFELAVDDLDTAVARLQAVAGGDNPTFGRRALTLSESFLQRRIGSTT